MSYNMPAGATQEDAERGGSELSFEAAWCGDENPFTVAATQCSRLGCSAKRVPSETDECADHAIVSALEMMEAIATLPEPDEQDCEDFGFFQGEIERLRGLAR